MHLNVNFQIPLCGIHEKDLKTNVYGLVATLEALIVRQWDFSHKYPALPVAYLHKAGLFVYCSRIYLADSHLS